MWSDNSVRNCVEVGYTFIHNGMHHTITRVFSDRIHCCVQGVGSYYMTYAYFQNTNHFKSRYRTYKRVGSVR